MKEERVISILVVGYETIKAEYNDKTKKITVGQRWLDMFNNPTTRNQAIRKLIHEQLHYKLSKSKEYVRSVQSIYDEFKKYLDENNIPKDAHIRDYLFENESTQLRALEEFLVESLTSEELARYLNGIKTSVPTKRGAKNLWQKILIALSDIFGWKVTKGSLYEKELNTIRELKLSSEDVEQNTETQTDNSESNVEQEDNNTDNNLQENSDNNLQENNKTDEEKIEVQDEETEETDESSDDFVDFSDDLIDEFESSITEQPVSQTETAYTKEEQDILSRAPRNANGQLLAPNGRVSNLTEKQYVQVRTKAFKDWFGDWEKGTIFTANNVDDIEELKRKYPSTLPNKFYHHSTNKFGRQPFDSREGTKEKLHIIGRLITDKVDALVVENPNSDNKISHITLATATGIKPFESNKELQLHQDKIQPLDDYVDTTFRNNMSNDVSKVVDENGEPLVVKHNSKSKDITSFDKNRRGTNGGTLFGKGFYFSTNTDYNSVFGNIEYNVFLNIKNPLSSDKTSPSYRIYNDYKLGIAFGSNEDDIQALLKNKGYDGVIAVNEFENNVIEYIAWDSNQIKSATDNIGTFSNEDDDIRHSSVTEENITLMSNVPSITSISDMLPLEQQPEFDSLVTSAEFETSCR